MPFVRFVLLFFALAMLAAFTPLAFGEKPQVNPDPAGICAYRAQVAFRWAVFLRPELKTMDDAKAAFAERIMANPDAYDEESLRATKKGIELVWGDVNKPPYEVRDEFYAWCIKDPMAQTGIRSS